MPTMNAGSRRVRFESRRVVTIDTAPIPVIRQKPQHTANALLVLAPLVPLGSCIAMLGDYLLVGAP